jgi:DNA-binding XRE family transcriptional regulator
MKQDSKYTPLFDHLRRAPQDELTLTFAEIEALLGEALPASARAQRGWWGNRSRGSPQAAAWMGAGYHVEGLDLDAERVTFRKPLRVYTVRREGDVVVWDSDLVKALRIHAGWSQAQLAEELGVRQQTVSEWETGVYQPSRHMCKFLMVIAERAEFAYDVKGRA